MCERRGTMRGKATLVAGAALVGLWMLGSAATAAAPETALWMVSESWAGGTQHDERLGQTVQFWGAGISLRDVFAGIQEQTGVEIGFWPAGDVNERVCVNLYLNPEKPPTLRELLAQLSWATDCLFGYWVEGGEAKYCLHKTTLGEGMVAAALAAPERRRQLLAQQTLDREPARREALREALSLSREEAIERHHGKNDLLLFAVLDPTRRAMCELYLSTPVGAAGTEVRFPLLAHEFSELTAEQQAIVRGMLQQALQAGKEGSQGPHLVLVGVEPDSGATALLESLLPKVMLIQTAGAEELVLEGWVRKQQPPVCLCLSFPRVKLEGEMTPIEEMDLREALGEELSREYESLAIMARRRQQRSADQRRWLEEQIGRVRLSADIERLLASVEVPVRLDRGHALWEIQEMVAEASGLHVVSDCFSQPERSLRREARTLYPGEKLPMTALMALRLMTVSDSKASWLELRGNPAATPVRWDWRDAGRFLSFRSVDRALWRGAFLPGDALEVLDHWVAPYLEGDEAEAEDANSISMEVDWRALGRLMERLDLVQRMHGGYLTYGDPADKRNAWRHAYRERVMREAWQSPWLYRFLASLSDAQFEQLKGEGLRVGVDMSVEDMAKRWECRDGESGGMALMDTEPWETSPAEEPGGWMGFEDGDVVRAEQGEVTREDRPAQWRLEIVKSEGLMSFGLDGEVQVRLWGTWRVWPSPAEVLEQIPPLPPPMTPEAMRDLIREHDEAMREMMRQQEEEAASGGG
jgi:hypothetical protein